MQYQVGFTQLVKAKSEAHAIEKAKGLILSESSMGTTVREMNGVARNANDVFKRVKGMISDFHKEHFLIASFDVRRRLLGVDILSIGILNASLVHPRETFIPALKHHASFVVVAHNHPSADLEPSEEDLTVTSRLEAAGKILGVELRDHLIVSKEAYYSFKEHNLL